MIRAVSVRSSSRGSSRRRRPEQEADVIVIGAPRWRRGATEAGASVDAPLLSDGREVSGRTGFAMLATDSIEEGSTRAGEATAAGGDSVLGTLEIATELARDDRLDAVMFGPLDKQVRHLADFGFEDVLRWLASRLDFGGHVTDLNVIDDLWTSRVTSHVLL